MRTSSKCCVNMRTNNANTMRTHSDNQVPMQQVGGRVLYTDAMAKDHRSSSIDPSIIKGTNYATSLNLLYPKSNVKNYLINPDSMPGVLVMRCHNCKVDILRDIRKALSSVAIGIILFIRWPSAPEKLPIRALRSFRCALIPRHLPGVTHSSYPLLTNTFWGICATSFRRDKLRLHSGTLT